jgi:hypothetical protein
MQDRARTDSGESGMLEAYLDMPVPENYYSMTLYQQRDVYNKLLNGESTGEYLRNAICIRQIRNEMTGEQFDTIRSGNDSVSRSLSRLMDALPGWHRAKKLHTVTGPIGKQRWFIRDGVDEDDLFELTPVELL